MLRHEDYERFQSIPDDELEPHGLRIKYDANDYEKMANDAIHKHGFDGVFDRTGIKYIMEKFLEWYVSGLDFDKSADAIFKNWPGDTDWSDPRDGRSLGDYRHLTPEGYKRWSTEMEAKELAETIENAKCTPSKPNRL